MINILVNKDGLIKDHNRDYILTNNTIVVLKDGDHILTYSDISSATCDVYQIDEEIEDFIGNKFMFIDEEVIENPDWIEPLEE